MTGYATRDSLPQRRVAARHRRTPRFARTSLACAISSLFLASAFAQDAAKPPPSTTQTLAQIDVVLTHSPKGARRLAEVLQDHPAPHLRVFCLSLAIAEALRDARVRQILSAPLPNETALLSLFTNLSL